MIRADGPANDPGGLDRMLSCLLHERYYVSGIHTNERQKLSLGWVGIDEQAADEMFAQSADTAVLLTGEIFVSEDQGKGTAASSAEHVLRAYESEGEGCLPSLNGWFSGIIHDRVRKKVLVFNDRYGHGRLYWHRNAEGLFFASEAKALLARFPRLRTLDPRGLAEWLRCGCVLQNRTLFSEIFLLPPASAWSIPADGATEERSYFQPEEWENLPRLSNAVYAQTLEDRLPEVLGRYLKGSRPIGMSLTGGLDGRILMAWAGSSPGELPCYTFNGPYRTCADARLAARVAEACGQSHQLIPMGEEFFRDFGELAAKSVYLSDGTMDVSGSAELYMNRFAREVAPVRLTGNYGSEILREYVAFRPGKQAPQGFDSSLTGLLSEAGETYAEEARGNRLSFIAFKQVPWHHYARSSLERSQLMVRSPFLDNDLVYLAFQASPEARVDLNLLLRLVSRGAPALGQIPTDRGLTYPGDSLVNRIRRAYQEFMAKAEYAYDYGMPQWLTGVDRRFSALHLEKLFLGHQKFCHFRIWYRERLAKTVREVLLDPSTLDRGVFDRTMVEQLVAQHLEGRCNHTSALHKLLSLEFIHRGLIDGSAAVVSPALEATVRS